MLDDVAHGRLRTEYLGEHYAAFELRDEHVRECLQIEIAPKLAGLLPLAHDRAPDAACVFRLAGK